MNTTTPTEERKMSLSVEELLLPRYKVIADYPHNPWLIGETLTINNKGELVGKVTGYVDYDYQVFENQVASYPFIFRKLEWWEEREESELPEYVVDAKAPSIFYKVIKWNEDHSKFQFAENRFWMTDTRHFLPMTREEYEAQQQKQ